MKKNPMTNTGIKKYKLTVAATMTDPNMLRMTWVASSIAFGRNSSVALQGKITFQSEIHSKMLFNHPIGYRHLPNILRKSIQDSTRWIRIKESHRS